MELAELKTAIDEHQSVVTEALQRSAEDVKALAVQVDKLELRQNRLALGAGGMDRAPAGELEAKAFTNFIRHGREGMDPAEVKSLQVSDDTTGGY
jgi:predicted phage gp36 major capsid-like protein